MKVNLPGVLIGDCINLWTGAAAEAVIFDEADALGFTDVSGSAAGDCKNIKHF